MTQRRSRLLALIDRRRIELRHEALSRGRQLYEEKPHVFAMRLHGYWSNWQQVTDSGTRAQPAYT